MRYKKIKAGAAIAAIATGTLAATSAGAMGGDNESITFGPNSVSLTILEGAGTFTFQANEVETGTVLGVLTGTEVGQVLTINIPPYCGLIQADGAINGRHRIGYKHAYNTCVTPPTTQPSAPPTTTVPPVTTTTVPAPVTTTTPPKPVQTTTQTPSPAPLPAPVTEYTPTGAPLNPVTTANSGCTDSGQLNLPECTSPPVTPQGGVIGNG